MIPVDCGQRLKCVVVKLWSKREFEDEFGVFHK